jgi:UDP-N-acetyl-D-mannosaminuronic acid dehydrogenase
MSKSDPQFTSLEAKILDRSARVVVVGLGHVGFPTSLLFARAGFSVTGVDSNVPLIQRLNRGEVHFSEHYLTRYFTDALRLRRFQAVTQIPVADVFIIAVPTPLTSDKRPDLGSLKSAAGAVGERIRIGGMVVVESSVPPRTCETVLAPMIFEKSRLRHGVDYDLVHCPERAMPGNMFTEVIKNNRIIGGTTREASERAAKLYRTFVSGEIFLTNLVTAELSKLMENTYRDVNIALANEFSLVCEALGTDVNEAIRLANTHSRVNVHQPGIGVGGQCLPKDPWFIVAADPNHTPLIQLARRINDQMPVVIANRIERELESKRLKHPGTRIGIIGLTYKPDVDDFRDSPALAVAHELQHRGYVVSVCDPWLSSNGESIADLNIQSSDEIVKNDYVVELVKHGTRQGVKPS